MCGRLSAQDAAYSQYFNSRVYLNPAFAGVDDGYRLALTHRNMWRTLPQNYVSTGASFDYKSCEFPRVGLGVIANTTSQGEGRLKTADGAFIFAFHTPYQISKMKGKQKAGSFTFALQLGVITRSIDWSKLVFGDQLDPVAGVIKPSSQAAATVQNVNSMDLSSGFLWRQRIYKVTFHLGGAFYHMNSPKEGLLVEGKLPWRTTLHGGLLLQMNKRNYLLPNFRYQWQGTGNGLHKVIDVGALFLNQKIFGGVTYRINPVNFYPGSSDAIVFMVGYEMDFGRGSALRFAYSFDTNVKGFSRGNFFTHELNIVYTIHSNCATKMGAINKNICDYEQKKLPQVF